MYPGANKAYILSQVDCNKGLKSLVEKIQALKTLAFDSSYVLSVFAIVDEFGNLYRHIQELVNTIEKERDFHNIPYIDENLKVILPVMHSVENYGLYCISDWCEYEEYAYPFDVFDENALFKKEDSALIDLFNIYESAFVPSEKSKNIPKKCYLDRAEHILKCFCSDLTELIEKLQAPITNPTPEVMECVFNALWDSALNELKTGIKEFRNNINSTPQRLLSNKIRAEKNNLLKRMYESSFLLPIKSDDTVVYSAKNEYSQDISQDYNVLLSKCALEYFYVEDAVVDSKVVGYYLIKHPECRDFIKDLAYYTECTRILLEAEIKRQGVGSNIKKTPKIDNRVIQFVNNLKAVVLDAYDNHNGNLLHQGGSKGKAVVKIDIATINQKLDTLLEEKNKVALEADMANNEKNLAVLACALLKKLMPFMQNMTNKAMAESVAKRFKSSSATIGRYFSTNIQTLTTL